MPLLFTTKLRRKLLAYSFAHPKESYYVRQLSGLIDEDAGNLSRELRKLEQEGLYNSFSKGKERFYSLNKDYPLFRELKKIVSKTEGIEGRLKKAVFQYKEIALAFIYGSYAKNAENINSDIDLFIIGDISSKDLQEAISDIENKAKREISSTVYSKKEFKEKYKSKNHFVLSVIKGPKIFLKGNDDGIRELVSGRTPN